MKSKISYIFLTDQDDRYAHGSDSRVSMGDGTMMPGNMPGSMPGNRIGMGDGTMMPGNMPGMQAMGYGPMMPQMGMGPSDPSMMMGYEQVHV